MICYNQLCVNIDKNKKGKGGHALSLLSFFSFPFSSFIENTTDLIVCSSISISLGSEDI